MNKQTNVKYFTCLVISLAFILVGAACSVKPEKLSNQVITNQLPANIPPKVLPELVTAKFNTDFNLRVGTTAVIESDNLKIKFIKVTEDSRCPVSVVCKWEGRATFVVELIKNEQSLGEVSLTVRPVLGGTVENPIMSAGSVENIGGYAIILEEVRPYPSNVQPIPPSDYVVTLKITQEDLSLPKSINEVSTSCKIDSDCTIVNKAKDYRPSCDTVAVCEIVDYSQDKYIAVNKESFNKFIVAGGLIKIKCPPPPPGTAGSASPPCALTIIDRGLVPRCINSICQKAPWVERNYGFDRIQKGQMSLHEGEKKNYVIKTAAEWEKLWRTYITEKPFSTNPADIFLPEVDFKQDMVVALFQGGRSTGGFGIEVTKVTETRQELQVFIKEIYPGEGCPVTEAITSPYDLIRLKKSDKAVSYKVEVSKADSCR